MAEKNVIRQDVVQIGFEVIDNPLNDLIKSMQEFQKAAQKAAGAMDEQDKNARKNAKGLQKMANTAKDIKGKLQPTLTKIDNGLKKIGKSAANAGKKIASGLGRLGKTAFKGLIVGAGAFATAVGVAANKFAEYEQLAGGAKKIFDKADISGILEDVNRAYIDLGMSANDYLAAMNNVGATFAATMGDQKGYDTAKLGLQAISNYATGTGKNVTELSDKFMMITRSTSSYQSIADQFSGILPATSADFLKQAQAAGFLSKKYSKLTDVPVAEYQEAVSKMLEKGTASLGLAGNTAKEAMTTVSGSIGMAKAAWENFLVGMADPEQDFDKLCDNVINSFVAVGENLIPVITRLAPKLGQGLLVLGKAAGKYVPPLLKKIGEKAIEYAPIVGAKFKDMLFKAKDYLVANSGKIWEGFKTFLAQGVATIYQMFTGEQMDIEGIKTKIQEIADKVMSFANSIKEHWPAIKNTLIGVAIAVGTLKAAIFACNAVIAINNARLKVQKARTLASAAAEKIKKSAVVQSTKQTVLNTAALVKSKAINAALAIKTKAVAAAQWLMNTSMYGCPIVWIIAGIAALIAIIILLVKNWDKVKEVAVKCWAKIKETWGKVKDWFSEKVVQPVKKFFGNMFDAISDKVSSVKKNIVDAFASAKEKVCSAWGNIKDFFSGIWKDAVKAVAKPVNKIIGGANWVLEKLGSKKRFSEWTPYAKGTNGHPGGNAIVNDGRGAELVQMPNGRTFIPKGRNVLLPNAPKGMKVLDAERTAKLLGRTSPTFNYEGGIGDWAIWDFFDNAKGLVQKVIDKFISWKDMGGYALDVGKAMVSKATGAMADWVKGLFKEHGGKSLADYSPTAGVEQWRSTVATALKMEGQHSAANIKRTLYQMQTESGGNPRAINNWDVNARRGTPSKGLMQVIDPTFKAYARKGYSSNIYDPLSNILASVRYAVSRYGSLEKAYRGVGYAGGIGFERLPLPSYAPSSSVPVSSSSSTHNNNYNPSFTLNMSGTVDRTTERTIKRWVMEALEEAFSSIERTSGRLTEV